MEHDQQDEQIDRKKILAERLELLGTRYLYLLKIYSKEIAEEKEEDWVFARNFPELSLNKSPDNLTEILKGCRLTTTKNSAIVSLLLREVWGEISGLSEEISSKIP